MKAQTWSGFAAVMVACLVGVSSAQQAGPLAGLDELLGKQKNLTTFHTYLKVNLAQTEELVEYAGG